MKQHHHSEINNMHFSFSAVMFKHIFKENDTCLIFIQALRFKPRLIEAEPHMRDLARSRSRN